MVATVLSIDAAALHRLLRDVAATAAPTSTPSVIHGVLLHTAPVPPDGPQESDTVLVGTATDRFILGQAHEPLRSGTLPATFVGLPEVRVLLAALHPASTTSTGAGDGMATLVRGDGTLTVTAGLTVCIPVDSGVGFPAAPVPKVAAEPTDATVQLAPRLLRILTEVAERRGEPMVLTAQAPGHPTWVHIGRRYHALVGTVRPATPPRPPLFVLEPTAGERP